MKYRHCLARLLLLVAAQLLQSTATADVLFESGTLGSTGMYYDDLNGEVPGGTLVSEFVFSGVRFELSRPAVTTRVGGHFVADPLFLDNSFFGAVVRLDGNTDFPNSDDLSSNDVLGATLLSFPIPSAEVFGDLPLHLDAGWYALMFGSGLFGTMGSGEALLNNPDIGSPDYIGYQPPGNWYDLSDLPILFENYRLVVEGTFVPEPNSMSTILVAAFFLGSVGISRERKRGRKGGQNYLIDAPWRFC